MTNRTLGFGESAARACGASTARARAAARRSMGRLRGLILAPEGRQVLAQGVNPGRAALAGPGLTPWAKTYHPSGVHFRFRITDFNSSAGPFGAVSSSSASAA